MRLETITQEASAGAGQERLPEVSLESEFGDMLRLLRLVRPRTRPATPMFAMVALEFQGDTYLSASTYDYSLGRQVHIGQRNPDLPTHGLLVRASSLERAVRLLAKGKPKTDKVKIEQVWILDLPKIFVKADGYSLAVDVAIHSVEEVTHWRDTITSLGVTGRTANEAEATWSAPELVGMFGRVKHAISKDETIPALNAAQLVWDSGRLRILATDRYRLARATMGRAATDGAGGKFERLLRLTDWSLIAPIIKDEDELHVTAAADEVLVLTGENCMISVACGVSGQYPKINALFDDRTLHTVVPKAEMLRAVVILGNLAERNRPIVLDHLGEGIRLSCDQDDIGQSQSPVIEAKGHNFGLSAINPHFLQDALRALPGDKVRLSWADVPPEKMKPIMITNADVPIKEQDTEFLIMPVRLPRPEPKLNV